MLRAGLDSAPASASASASGSGSASSKAKPVPATKPKVSGKKNKAVASATSAKEPAKKKKKSADGSATEARPPRTTPDEFYKEKGSIRGPVKGETDKQKRKRLEMNRAFKIQIGEVLETQKAKFDRMVRAILEKVCEETPGLAQKPLLKMESGAKRALREAAEKFLVEDVFAKTAMAATHAGRVTAKITDMWLVDAMVFDSKYSGQFKNADEYKKVLDKQFAERAAERAAEAEKKAAKIAEQAAFEDAEIDPEARRIYESESRASAAAAEEEDDEKETASAAPVPMAPVPVFSASASAAAAALAPLVVPAALFAQPAAVPVVMPEVKVPVEPVAAHAAAAVASAASVAVPVSPSPVSGPEPMADADAVPVVDRPDPKTPVNPHEEKPVAAAPAAAPVAAEEEPTVAAAPVAAGAVAPSKPKKVRAARMTELERLTKAYLKDAKTNA